MASPIKEHEREGSDVDEDDNATETSAASGGCSGCFGLFRFNMQRSNGGEGGRLLRQQNKGGEEVQKETWVAKKLREAKDLSEVVAGPKWKNFVRRMGKWFNQRRKKQFQYDPYSYALNFDDGEEDGYYNNLTGYSSRFSAPLSGDTTVH